MIIASDPTTLPWAGGYVEFVLSRIEAAVVRPRPFPYLVVKDVLPEPLYQALIPQWPADELFRTTNYKRRRQIYLNRTLGLLPEEASVFWRQVLDISDTLNRALFRKFRPHFGRRFEPLLGPNWPSLINGTMRVSFREAHLAQYTGDAGLHPHVDSLQLVTNAFLYVSERDEIEPDLGTVLYRSFGFMMPENEVTLSVGLQERLLAEDVIVPYRPNSLLAFLNTPSAFHGMRDADLGERKRRLLLFSPVVVNGRATLAREFKQRPPIVDSG
jgi:hypothetical protein